MVGTPEEDLLAWLEREEERLGFATVETGLTDIDRARALFYDELGYDITDEQFMGLKQAEYLRYEELPAVDIRYEGRTIFRDKLGRFTTKELAWSSEYEHYYRDLLTGRLMTSEAAFTRVKARK